MAKTKKNIKVNMKNVDKSGGRNKRYPEGDYKVRIEDISMGKPNQSGDDVLVVTYELIDGPATGSFKDYMNMGEKSLWRIGNLMDALGIKWKNETFALPIDKMEGSELGLTISDHEFNNKTYSKVTDFLDADTVEAIVSGGGKKKKKDKDEPKKGKGKKGKKAADIDVDENL